MSFAEFASLSLRSVYLLASEQKLLIQKEMCLCLWLLCVTVIWVSCNGVSLHLYQKSLVIALCDRLTTSREPQNRSGGRDGRTSRLETPHRLGY